MKSVTRYVLTLALVGSLALTALGMLPMKGEVTPPAGAKWVLEYQHETVYSKKKPKFTKGSSTFLLRDLKGKDFYTHLPVDWTWTVRKL